MNAHPLHHLWRRHLVLVIVMLLLLMTMPVSAQEQGLTLRLNRDFGYAGFSGDIQGTFSFRVSGPDNLREVEFYIDDQLVGVDYEAPWRYQFRTDDFALGVHELYAIGRTDDGKTLKSNVLRREFVPAAKGWKFAAKILVPLLILTLLIPVTMYLLERRQGKKPGRGYGVMGGAVCPRCGYPFARHFWAPNLGLAKFDRCPNCGKWSVVRRASTEELERAEQQFFAESKTVTEPQLSEEDKLRQQIEESKYE
ncbi:MAG: hypothetical protein GXP38_17535 [Chloroflexi bacterium]|nr:hypothetical protein [Chloroflexota bacterium]